MNAIPWTLAAALALSACAGPHASGTYETRASMDRVYAAALDAVPAVGYRVVTVSKSDGLILAQQGVVMGNGSTNGLNVSITDAGGWRHMGVSFQAPPGTLALGSFEQNVTQYIAAVKSRVPDLRASAR